MSKAQLEKTKTKMKWSQPTLKHLRQDSFLSEAGTIKMETVPATGDNDPVSRLQLSGPQTGPVMVFVKGQGFLFNSLLDLDATFG